MAFHRVVKGLRDKNKLGSCLVELLNQKQITIRRRLFGASRAMSDGKPAGGGYGVRKGRILFLFQAKASLEVVRGPGS